MGYGKKVIFFLFLLNSQVALVSNRADQSSEASLWCSGFPEKFGASPIFFRDAIAPYILLTIHDWNELAMKRRLLEDQIQT